jgi:L-arabinose isomerase
MTASKLKSIKVGLFGIGLDTYWPQFAGLKDRLVGYQNQISARLKEIGNDTQGRYHAGGPIAIEVVDAGLVDNVEKARTVGDMFKREDVEIIFLYVSTYALSSTVLPVVQKARCPVVALNLQPTSKIDLTTLNAMGDRGKMTGEWLANCQACSMPEIACVFNRAKIDYHIITGTLTDGEAWREIGAWVDAARVKAVMRENRVGILGHYYCGMLDVYSDMTQQAAVFGNHFELLEMCQLEEIHRGVSDDDVAQKLAQFKRDFVVSGECTAFELARASKTSVALDRLVAQHRLGSMAYYYEGADNTPIRNIATSVIAGNTLLTAQGVPVAGECEIKNVQAMKIMDALGVGGSFSEFYAMDFDDDVVLLGHDGPAHAAIAQQKVRLVPLPVYHGKPGVGLSIQMEVREGPATLLSVVQDGAGKLSLLVAEGMVVPGPTLQIGNTNSRYRFSIGAKRFINEWSKAGPAHHCAIGIAHVAERIEKLAALLGIECKKIC